MIEQRPWNMKAGAELLPAAGDEWELASVADEVRQDLAQLWRVKAHDAAGWLVTRVEEAPHGQELVLVLGAGEGAAPVIEWAQRLARNNGISRIRTHVSRPGLERIYQRAGFKREHVVMVYSDGQ